jgi:dTDP-D-glucose 4,6-dehydratase
MASISKITEQLKYQPRQRFEEGLRLALGWYFNTQPPR